MAKKEDHKTEIHNDTEVTIETEVTQSVSGSDEQVAELTADLQRLQAEFQNYKRRTSNDFPEGMRAGVAKATKEFIVLADSFDAETKYRIDGKVTAENKLVDAFRLQLEGILKALEVRKMDTENIAFEPQLHEAVASHDSEGAFEYVAEELRPGYFYQGSVLRPAMVKVGHSNTPRINEDTSSDLKIRIQLRKLASDTVGEK